MKKVLALTLALIMAMSMMVACNNDGDKGNDVVSPATSAVELLNGAYDAFATAMEPIFGMSAEDIKMSFMGGYWNESDPTTLTQGPGTVPVEDASITTVALLPAESVAMVDDAALIQHPMMLNYFVTTAYHVTDLANVDTVASALNDNIKNNPWMCGQPEGFYVIVAGDYVVSMYGLYDNINAMKDALLATYEGAAVAYEGSFIG